MGRRGTVRWLDIYNGAVLALLTVVRVGVTAWYAYTTHLMMKTAQHRLDAAMPVIVVKSLTDR